MVHWIEKFYNAFISKVCIVLSLLEHIFVIENSNIIFTKLEWPNKKQPYLTQCINLPFHRQFEHQWWSRADVVLISSNLLLIFYYEEWKLFVIMTLKKLTKLHPEFFFSIIYHWRHTMSFLAKGCVATYLNWPYYVHGCFRTSTSL